MNLLHRESEPAPSFCVVSPDPQGVQLPDPIPVLYVPIEQGSQADPVYPALHTAENLIKNSITHLIQQ